MKNLVIVLGMALFSISMSAQEVTPTATAAKPQPAATVKKGCCSKDHKTATTETASATEKKSCDKDKKPGCCAKKA